MRTKRTLDMAKAALKMRQEGAEYTAIGERLGVSKSYAYQLVSAQLRKVHRTEHHQKVLGCTFCEKR